MLVKRENSGAETSKVIALDLCSVKLKALAATIMTSMVMAALVVMVSLSLFMPARCVADQQDPLVMIKGVTDRMVAVLTNERAKIDQDDQYLNRRIEEIVLPCVDVDVMARSVVGRQYWQQASERDRADFVKVFTKYVENTYSGALKSYNGEEVKFPPMRSSAQRDKKRAQVTCVFMMDGGAVTVVYKVYYKRDRWLIYDFSINNVSLVKNYNAQFAGVLRQHGLIGLVKQLSGRYGALMAN